MMEKIFKKKEFAIFGIIVLLSVFLSIISDAFFKVDNLIDLLKGNVVLGVMALGMLPVLISGGIDLSVSANITLCSVIAGKMLVETEANLFMVILVCVLVGALIGIINGILISKIKIPPIVATLGTLSIVLGGVLFYTKGNMITNLPKWFREFGISSINIFGKGLPIQILFLIITIAITWLLLNYTLIGRSIYAVGGNESSAERVGYNIDRTKIFIYAYCGFMAGLAAVINTSIVQGVNPNTFTGIELVVISTVVIGGASTLGGIGTVLGTVLGILLMAILNNGLVLAKVPTFWQKIVMGSIIIIAVSIDVINRRKEQDKLVRVDVEE